MTSSKIRAAKPVRKATTVKGEKPLLIAIFPNTGAKPRKNAELNAASTPAVCFFCKEACLIVSSFDERSYFFEEFIVEEVTFLQQGLDLPTQPTLFIRG